MSDFTKKAELSKAGTAMDTTSAPQIIEHIHKSLNYTPYETLWVPCSARFCSLGISTKAKGILQIYELSKGESEMKTKAMNATGNKCATFGHSSLESRSIAVGDYAGCLKIWDLERFDVPTYQAQAHSSIVNAVDGVGARDRVGGAGAGHGLA